MNNDIGLRNIVEDEEDYDRCAVKMSDDADGALSDDADGARNLSEEDVDFYNAYKKNFVLASMNYMEELKLDEIDLD